MAETPEQVGQRAYDAARDRGEHPVAAGLRAKRAEKAAQYLEVMKESRKGRGKK